MSNQKDLVVIGSGPGGYVAGIRAAQLGLDVAVVEKDPKFGGTCLHRGCIPTKALLHSAEMLEGIRGADKLGIVTSAPQVDIDKVQAYKKGVVDKNAKGVDFLFKKNKIEGVHGLGRITGANQVTVSSGGAETVYQAKNILIATGSVPRDLPFAPADGKRVLNSDHALELAQVPRSIAILGAGAVGCEFASIFASFGSKVTLIEYLPRLLPIEDEDVSKELLRSFKKRKIDVMTSTKLCEVEGGSTTALMKLERGGETVTLEAEYLLVAVGRAPVTAGLGLEGLGIEVDRGYVGVNEWMQTNVENVYAIGDVVNTPWLAHVASAEGVLAAEHMAGLSSARPVRYDRVPSCTYCDPEVGSVGLSEAAAREKGYDVAVGKFPFSALGKAGILGKTAGFVKVVREVKYDEVLGVHIIGVHATDLIAEACVALQMEATTEELYRTMHAHPTLSEAVAEASHAAVGHAIHI